MNTFKTKTKKLKFCTPQKLLHHCTTALLPLCLSGCMGVYEGGFECPPGEGVGCKSISEVNELVNQRLDYKSVDPNSESKPLEKSKSKTCGKDHTCPINPNLPDIWYVPQVFKHEPQGWPQDELRSKSRDEFRDKSQDESLLEA